MLEIRIAGLPYNVEVLQIGEKRVFHGAGFIRATSLTRSSKDTYELHVVRDDASEYQKQFSALPDAVAWLQNEYNENGSLLGWIAQHQKKTINQGA